MLIKIEAVKADYSDGGGRPCWQLIFTISVSEVNIRYTIEEAYLEFAEMRKLVAGKCTHVGFYQGNGDGSIAVKGESMTLTAELSGDGGDVDSSIEIPLVSVGGDQRGGPVQDVLAMLGAALDHAEEEGWYIAE